MLKKAILAVAASLPLLLGAAAISATPAAAWHHGKPHYQKPQRHCHWTTQRVKVWTSYGPRWRLQKVRVCSWR